MRKKYFAKYIRLEGKPEEGDYFIPEGSSLVFLHKGIHPETGKIIAENEGYDASIVPTWNNLKVRLELCSREVVVGDRARNIHNDDLEFTISKIEMGSGKNYFPMEMLVWFKDNKRENTDWLPLKDCFKVITKISTKAYWIKDGDEFDESQIKFNYRKKTECLCSQSDSNYWWSISNRCTYEDEDHYNRAYTCGRKIDVIYEAEILGPCGHFH